MNDEVSYYKGERELEFAQIRKKQGKFLFISNYSSACFVLMEFLKGLFFPDLRLGWNDTVLEREASQINKWLDALA